MRIFNLNIPDLALIAGTLGVGIGILLLMWPKPLPQAVPFTRPPATNAFYPDPDINEWSYKNAIRQDYEAMERIATGRVAGPNNNDSVGWNVGNIHPSFENYLQKKYF